MNKGTNTGNDEQNVSSEVTIEKVMSSKETPASEFQYEYEEEFGGIVIDDYHGAGGIVVIPEKIDGIDVVRINDKAFVNNDTITAVKLSNTVREVGKQAFMNCSKMKIFISGESLKLLDQYTFNGCGRLETVKLNDGLEVMEILSFGNTIAIDSSLRELEIPSTVTKINAAFCAPDENPIVIIGTPGSAADEYVKKNGEECNLEFRAK